MGAQATLRLVCKREAVARREPEELRHTPNGAAGDGAHSASKPERSDDTNGRTNSSARHDVSDRVNNHNGAKRAEQKRELGLSDSWVAQWVGLYRKKATVTQVPCDHAHVNIGAERPQVVIE